LPRLRKCVVLAGVILLAFGGIASTASAMPDNISETIRGLGSDTTIFMMESLDRAYNDSQGCSVLSTPQRLDTVCGTDGPPFGFNSQTIGTLDNWDHDVATSLFPIGSGNGINVLRRFGQPGYPRIDYARSSRSGSTAEKAEGLRFVAYAEDAIAPVDFQGQISPKSGDPCFIDRGPGAVFDDDGPLGHTFGNNTSGPNASALGVGLTVDDGTWLPANGAAASATNCPLPTPASNVTNLSTQNIKDIWQNCTLTDWHTLDAHVPAGTAIVVWADQAGSGTRGTWDGFIAASGGNSTSCIPPVANQLGGSGNSYKDGNFNNGERVIFENDATPISGISNPTGGRQHTCNDVYRSGQIAGDSDCRETVLESPDATGTKNVVAVNTVGSTLNYTQSVYYFSFGQWQITSGTGPRTVSDAHTSSGSPNVSSATANFTSADAGRAVTGTNIPNFSYIVSVTDSTDIVISQNASGTSTTGTLTVGGDPEHPKGQGSVLLSWDGTVPNVSSIQSQGYSGFRFLFNAYRNAYPQDNAPDWVRDYVGEQGWICKADATTAGDQGFHHDTDPKTGVSYGTEISNIIFANGFVPIPYGPIGGSVVGSSKCRIP